MTATTIPDFNPSGDTRVQEIKAKTEELLNYVSEFGGDERCKALALTNYEQAAMWAVKSLFVK